MDDERLALYVEDEEIRCMVKKILCSIPECLFERKRFAKAFKLASARAIVGKNGNTPEPLFELNDARFWDALHELMYAAIDLRS